MANLSYYDVRRMVQKGLYRLETGAKSHHELIYDRKSGKYVGHFESGKIFQQDRSYQVPQYILVELDELKSGDWENGSGW